MLVVGRRNAEIAKNNLSYPYDEQKTRKTTFRTPTMSRKREKPRFVGVRRTKNAENRLSAMAEEQKTTKTTFRPRPKLKKQRKTAFSLSGSSKIDV